MSTVREPDAKRFVTALRGEQPDCIPNWEFFIMRRSLEAFFGEEFPKVEDETRAFHNWPENQRLEFSWDLPPGRLNQLAFFTGQDCVCVPLTWLPNVRDKSKVGEAYDQNGIVADRSDLEKLPPVPEPGSVVQKLDAYLETRLHSPVGVGVHLRSVFCNTYEVLGMVNFMLKLYDDVGLVEEIMDYFLEYSVGVAELLRDRPIDYFALDDDIAANAGLLVSEDVLRELWIPRTAKILEPIRAAGIPILEHCCGNLTDVIPLGLELGVTGFHPFQPNCNDVYAFKEQYGNRIAIVGNIDIAGVLAFGTPETVEADVLEHMKRLGDGGGYIVCSSHTIDNNIPPENYRAMIDAVRSYGVTW